MSKILTKYKKTKKYKKPKIKLLSGWKTLLLLVLLSINSTSSDPLMNSHYKNVDQEVFENTSIRKEMSQLADNNLSSIPCTSITGHFTKCWQTVGTTHLLCLVDGRVNKWGSKTHWISHKIRNKLVKASNGNRNENKIVKILHWNLGNKLWQNKKVIIEALILERTPDLLFISEANLMDTLPADERNLPGYELLLPSTMEKHKCARLVLLVRDGINVTLNTKMMHEDVQVIWVSVNIGRRSNMKVGGVYREHQMLLKGKPNPTKTEEAQIDRWNKFLHGWKLASKDKMCILTGDTNLDYMRWQNPEQGHKKMVQRTKDIIEEAGHTQMVRGPTRCWPGQADSLVDQCWVSLPQRIVSCTNEVRASSDHNLVSTLVRTKDKLAGSQEILKRTWKNFSLDNFRLEVSQLDWTTFHETENLDILNTIFEENVNSALEKVAPLKSVQIRKNHRNWVDLELKQLMASRDSLRETARQSSSQLDWDNYKITRNRCNKMLLRKKHEYVAKLYDSFQDKKDTKNIYKITKDILGWTTAGPPTCLLWEEKLARKPAEIANILQKIFTEKIQKLISGLVKNGRDPCEYLNRAMNRWEGRVDLPVFEITQISTSETLKLISNLGNSTSFGRDYIDAKSLKYVADYLAFPINKIINSSIKSGDYIMKWKTARVIPVLKAKEKSRLLPSSYRPISLLPVLSKLVERTVQIQLQRHFEKHRLFHQNSHAYRPHKSTSTAIMAIMDSLYMATDSNLISSMMALDMSAAFDTVNHDILLQKMKIYRCSQNTLKWMSNYLSSRSQVVNIGRHQSLSRPLDRGVPQGSILGPLLYLVFTNEMPDTITDPNCTNTCHLDRSKLFVDCTSCGQIFTYADDTTILLSDKKRCNNQAKLNYNLDRLEQYLANNDLAINVDKTCLLECMISQKRGRTPGDPPHLIVKDPKNPGQHMKVADSKNFRLLGSNLQPNIGWKMHLETGTKAVLPDIRKKLGSLKHLGTQIPFHSRKLLAEGLLISKLQYLISQWGGANQTLLTAAQRTQNKIARWVTGGNKRTRVRKLLTECGWLSIREQIDYHTTTQLWKVFNFGKPETISQKIHLDDENTASTSTPRLQFTSSGFRWRATKVWNDLPTDLRHSPSLPGFKKKLRLWIVQQRNWDPD